ncbi:MFS transporter [Thermoactinospora rubra]|uniref:MFS transporter n=1 Tax=Thermoactinospora rubra TaxID=1088767 RepID=UPI001F0AC4A0|nr:MFS transporter [Thermoactinospora rubra]
MPLRRNTQFQLLWLGSAVSQLGTELTKLAMPLLVLALTGSPGLAGVVTGARLAALVITQMPAGVWVDRWDRRRTLIMSQGVQTLAAAVLAALVMTDSAAIWHFVALGIVDGVCTAFVGPVRTTAIRAVVPEEQLHSAYAQEESRGHAARLIGPPLGGLLYGFGRAIPFVVDAITFAVALVCAIAARLPRRPGTTPQPTAEPLHPTAEPLHPTPETPEPAPTPKSATAATTKRSMRREAGEALAWLWRQPGLREVCAAVLALNLLGGAGMLPLIVLVGERGGSAFTTGTVFAGIGIGGLIGALLSGRAAKLLPPGKLLIVFPALLGLAYAAMALPFGPWWPFVPMLLVSLVTPTLNVVMNVVLTRVVPDHMLGRMDALLGLAGTGLTPLGPVIGGALAATLGGAGTLVLVGALLLAMSATTAASREVRHFTGTTADDA